MWELLVNALAMLNVGFFLAGCPCCGGTPPIGTPVPCTCCLNGNAPAELTVTIAGVTADPLGGQTPSCGANCVTSVNGTYVVGQSGSFPVCAWSLRINKCPGACQFGIQNGYDWLNVELACTPGPGGQVFPILRAYIYTGTSPNSLDPGLISMILWSKNLAPYAGNDPSGRPNCCGWASEVLATGGLGVGPCLACNKTGSTATIAAGAC